MSLFVVQRHIANLQQQKVQLGTLLQRLDKFSLKVEAEATLPLNSVCFAEVTLKHTSEVMVSIGGGYFVECTKEQAVAMAKRRKLFVEENLQKLQVISGKTEKQKAEEDQGGKQVEKREKKKGFEKIPLEKNEAGEDVFEIIEYPDQDNKSPDQHNESPEIQLTKTHPAPETLPPKIQQVSSPPSIPAPTSEPPRPKRISKFKQQRLQQRQL